MAITPSTNLYILKNPLEMDNKNQLTFSDKQSQLNYFKNLESQYVDNFTYQRQNSTIRFPVHIDSILEYNYCMYQNENYSNKWFYAYITNMRYLNDNCTEITIETDAFQTWQFDIEYKQCFVEREHVNDDTIGLHTVPENLELGDYIIENNNSRDLIRFSQYWAIIAVSEDIDGSTGGSAIDNMYSGLILYAFDNAPAVNNFINNYTGRTDAIVNMYICPKGLLTTDKVNSMGKVIADTGIDFDDYRFSVNLNNFAFGSYVPKNKKLYCYPYNVFYLTNNMGKTAEYHPELFEYDSSTNNIILNFKLYGTILNNVSCLFYPSNYSNLTKNLTNSDEGLSISGFPQCPWTSDYYSNWLAQNSFGNEISLTTSLMNTGLSMMSGGSITPSTTSSFINELGYYLNQTYQAQLTPNQAKGNTGSNNVLSAHTKMGYTFFVKTIKEEYARIIDKFFDLCGYKVNQVKVPNITGRRNWNYVKTVGCNLHGYFPQEDVQTLKNMFDNGVTLWHNAQNFLDYSQNNDII